MKAILSVTVREDDTGDTAMSETLAIYSVISLEATEPELLKSFDNYSILEDWLTNNAERIGRFLVATNYVDIPSINDEE